MNEDFKVTLQPISIEKANNRQRKLLEQAKETYRTLPKMQMIMANAPALLQSYLDGMAMFRDEGLFTPIEQEVIFMVISYQNECYPCLTAHSMIAEKFSKVPVEIINEIKERKPLSDKKLNALAVFTATMVSKRGFPSAFDISNFLEMGYLEVHILSIIHAISLKTISNYTNHVFQSELNNKLSLEYKRD